jgi:transposase
MGKQVQYSPEVRERAVRLFQEHVHEHPSRWAAMQSIASKIGCTTQSLSTCEVLPVLVPSGVRVRG